MQTLEKEKTVNILSTQFRALGIFTRYLSNGELIQFKQTIGNDQSFTTYFQTQLDGGLDLSIKLGYIDRIGDSVVDIEVKDNFKGETYIIYANKIFTGAVKQSSIEGKVITILKRVYGKDFDITSRLIGECRDIKKEIKSFHKLTCDVPKARIDLKGDSADVLSFVLRADKHNIGNSSKIEGEFHLDGSVKLQSDCVLMGVKKRHRPEQATHNEFTDLIGWYTKFLTQ